MNTNKNLLILCSTLNKGGAERVISLLLNEYSKKNNVNIHLIMLEDGIEYILPSSIRPIILTKTKKSDFRKFVELPYRGYKLSKYINTNNIDIVMSFLYRPNYINILSKLFTAKHVSIINIRSTTSRYLKEGLSGKINLFLIKLLFNKADLIVSNSYGVDLDLKSIINVSTKTKVIHNPIDINYINNKKNICENTEFKFKNNIKYIISVGRIIPLKRNKDLIRAFYEIVKYDDKLELLFLGDGILKNELMNYCKDLDIYKKVHFLGNVDNPFYYLNNSYLFVLNSETEGFPNVLIEAMAIGLKVISSDCKSGPREILDDGKYGLLYKVGDIKELIEKMKYYLYETPTSNNIKLENLKRSHDFRIEKIIYEFNEILYK